MNYRQADIHDILPVTLLWVKMIQEVFDGFVNLDKVELDAFSFAMCDRIRYPNTYTLLAESEGKSIGRGGGPNQRPVFGAKPHVAGWIRVSIQFEYRGKG